MPDWDDISPLAVFAIVVIAIIGLIWLATVAEDSDIADFKKRCIAAGSTAAQCEILAEVKRDSDDAEIMSSAAIGFAAGSSAGRR